MSGSPLWLGSYGHDATCKHMAGFSLREKGPPRVDSITPAFVSPKGGTRVLVRRRAFGHCRCAWFADFWWAKVDGSIDP